MADSSGIVLFCRSHTELLTPSDFVLHKVDTPQCQMCYITFPVSRILQLSKPCHVYVDSQAPIMQSFPLSLANKHPIKMCSYHGFFLTNLGSLDVNFGFVGGKKKVFSC